MRATDLRLRRAASILLDVLRQPETHRASSHLASLKRARSVQEDASTVGVLTRRDLIAATLSVQPRLPGLGLRIHDSDVKLMALVDELHRAREQLNELLSGDGRDTCDIPGFDQLADRHRILADAVSGTRAIGMPGLLAKAKSVDPTAATMRSESALAISMSIIADLLAISEA